MTVQGWLSEIILGNSLFQLFFAVTGFFLTVFVLRIAQHLLGQRLAELAVHTETYWDDIVAELIKGTRLLFLFILGLFVASLFLELPARLQTLVSNLVIVALLIQAGLWGGSIIHAILNSSRQKAIEKNTSAVTTINVIGFISMVLLWTFIVLLVLDNLGVDITALVAGLGIGGIAIALAMQNILGDLFASLSIVLDKPFVHGDFIIIDEFLGSVENIGLKTTRIRSLSGEQLVFANSDLLNSRIRNYGRMFERRVVFNLGVIYQTPREKLKHIPVIIREIIDAQDHTRFDRSHFMKYGDYSLNFETVYYVLSPDYNIYMDIQQTIYFAIHERFEQAEIEFAYPTQTVFVAQEA